MIEDARLDGRTATITVRFDADIAAVTRNQEGEVVAGSLSDAVETHDVWTFRRTLGSDDPNWLLVETDEAYGQHRSPGLARPASFPFPRPGPPCSRPPARDSGPSPRSGGRG